MNTFKTHHFIFQLIVLVLCFMFLGVYGFAGAQDAPTDVPTDVPTEEAIEVVTDVPTDVPTEEPTDVPTDAPTEEATDVPTDVPTDEPTDTPTEEATEVPTEEPTLPAEAVAPVFNLDVTTVYTVVAGQSLAFQFSVSDEAGVVRVLADNPAVTINAIDPVESAAPFNTVVQLVYTAPADASGATSFTLTALDADGLSAVVVVQLNVTPVVVVTEEPEAPISETPLPVVTEERLITFNPAASEEAIQAMLAALNAVELERIPQIGVMRVMIPQAVSTGAAAITAMQGNSAAMAAGLSSIEVNGTVSGHFEPNDPFYQNGTQWSLEGHNGSIWANFAWDISKKDGLGITVAVLDSGIDLQHPEFIGQLVPGWDFVNDDNNPDDDFGHGTHVAGIIAAKTNNAVGIAGVAFKSKLMPIKVLNSANSGTFFDVAAGIIFATDKGAKIINMSLGGGASSVSLEGAVAYALSRNVVVIASAGNTYDTGYQYPASIPGVISVAATDINGDKAEYSTFNDRVTIAAPGGDDQNSPPSPAPVDPGIWSTLPLANSVVTGPYGNFSGTSMAAPHVAGIAALIMADGYATTPATVREALICSAIDKGAPGYDNEFGYGLVQADYALNWNSNSSNCKVGSANDQFQTALKIAKAPFQISQAVHTRSVTTQATDPTLNCGVPTEQSLWYSFTPTASGYYQISTFGSSYDTLLSVYFGQQGILNEVLCNDDFGGALSGASLINVPLTAKQTYYIMASTGGTAVDDEVLNLQVAPAIINTLQDNQENGPALAYGGIWSRIKQTGASGSYVSTTSDNNATIAFSFRGVKFDYVRTVGPDKGSTEVWVDGILWDTISNRAAVTQANVPAGIDIGVVGQWHSIVLKRAVGGPAGNIDVDRIRTYETSVVPNGAVTSLTDDRTSSVPGFPCAAKKFCYTGGVWTQVGVAGSYKNTVTSTTVEDATVTFRTMGSTVTIFRNIAPGFGDMDVYVDGAFWGTVNNSYATATNVPFLIDGLSPTSHVIQLENNTASTLQFDAAQSRTPVALPASIRITDERAANLSYGGVWTKTVDLLAYTKTTMVNQDNFGAASFSFIGNRFCVGYVEQAGGAGIGVYVDGVFQGSFTTDNGGAKTYGSRTCFGLYNDAQHLIRLVNFSGGIMELDFVEARRQTVITPAMGLVQETSPAIIYDTLFGNWLVTSARSVGGAQFQGGKAKYATADGARLGFYINGTGFILYGSAGPGSAFGDYEVYVDGVLTTTFDYDYYRFRPQGFGLNNLTPGLHYIEIQAINVPVNGFLDFDAVRVFP